MIAKGIVIDVSGKSMRMPCSAAGSGRKGCPRTAMIILSDGDGCGDSADNITDGYDELRLGNRLKTGM